MLIINSVESRVSYFQFRIFISAKHSDSRKIRKFQRILLSSLSTRLFVVRNLFEEKLTNLFVDLFPLNYQEKLKLALDLNFNLSFNDLVPFFLSKKKGLSFYFELPNLSNICLQALCNLAILPFVEPRSDRFSFGFRPYRYSSDVFLYIKKLFQSHRNLSFIDHHKFDLLNSLDTNVWLFKNFPFDKAKFKNLVKEANISFSHNDQDFYVRQFDFFNTIKNFLFDGLVRIFKSKFYFTLTF